MTVRFLPADDLVRQRLLLWLPALTAGLLAWIVFLFPGQTPWLRATGMALVIVAMGMLLRRFGGALALCSSLVLAFSPAFWTQTGGSVRPELLPALTLAALAIPAGLLLLRRGGRLLLPAVCALALVSLAFWNLQGQAGSLRLTALAGAWLLVLLVDLLLRARPHPVDAVQDLPHVEQVWAMLALLAVGIVNTSLFVLFVPAVIAGILLAGIRPPRWFWLLPALLCVVGLNGIAGRYLSSDWWLYPAAQADQEGLVLPFLLADGWREASRWLALLEILRSQLTIPGGLLALVGLARLSRWYPATGIVTLLAWGSQAFFGLLYFGRDSAVLLLPLHMISIAWMTVAVRAISDWVGVVTGNTGMLTWLVTALYFLLPAWQLWQRLPPAWQLPFINSILAAS